LVESINALRPSFAALQEHELRSVSGSLKSRYDSGESLDELLPEAYALVREATFRKLGKAHYDVQLMGAVVLHRGSIAEMATGEGKSLTGILPAYLYALSGDSVFMVTVNDYLAKRDAQLFHSVLELLGMEVSPLRSTENAASSLLNRACSRHYMFIQQVLAIYC
jgi:preprotein translocase subunit SecA